MKNNFITILSFLCFILLWQILVSVFNIEKWILPSPSGIIISFWDGRALFITHMIPTLLEALAGLALAIILGIVSAIIMKLNNPIKIILYPFLILSQTIPFIVLAPLITIWFGFGFTPKIIIITLICFFPIALNFYDGFNRTDQAKIRLLNSMKANKKQKIFLLFIPSSLPSFFSGLRIAASYSVLGAVISEWIGTEKGLGLLLIRSSKSYLTERVFAVITVITIMSLLLLFMVKILEAIFIPWHYQDNKNMQEKI
jgi:ABC-type nitrate/sulfonate/bicarbonate transport system permease component